VEYFAILGNLDSTDYSGKLSNLDSGKLNNLDSVNQSNLDSAKLNNLDSAGYS
jgi:hypothetical protein